MLVSLNWIRDFVDLPRDIDPRELAERFTLTTAEVEGIEQVTCDATGLIAAEILSVQELRDTAHLCAVTVNTGSQQLDTVTAAEDLSPGDRVIFAPPGSTVPGIGLAAIRKVAGRTSAGMILSGGGLGLTAVGPRAVWLTPATKPGSAIDMSPFNDWIIEIDNKSITHRPDLWGHYGIARECAAMYSRPLKPYPVVPRRELTNPDLPEIPIVIDDPVKCPRYSGLRFTGVRPQPAPLWMQVRLAHVGLRPIDLLVDLTNYVMAELGQPMHAFDGTHVDRIEVALARPGEKFTTLDGVQRTMPDGALMIQCQRRSVALAGIMGGADTEVTPTTTDLLLESANFEPATIRRCAAALGHRTDASARFEKSLDPSNTVLGIRRFVYLARPELPDLKLTSRLSDAFPAPPGPTVIRVDPEFVNRYVGREVPLDQIKRVLTALEFTLDDADGTLEVTVPSFRATRDVTIEADVIEEIARFVGYGSIEPALPVVTVRNLQPDAMGRLERQTLSLLCGGMSYAEIHRPIWFDSDWLGKLGYDPGRTIVLRNPAAAGSERLRTTLAPGLLAAVDLNRHHFDRFELVEVGSVFDPEITTRPDEAERRHLALALVAPGRKTDHEDALLRRLKTDLETCARQVLNAHLRFAAAEPAAPWEHEAKTATVALNHRTMGRVTVLTDAGKRRIDEHLAAWSIALGEINLSPLVERPAGTGKLPPVPVYPRIDLDFSVVTPAQRQYAEIEHVLGRYDHPLLRRLAFVDSYEGGSVPADRRSLTFRATIGDETRTLTEQDIQDFRTRFIEFLEGNQLTLRT